MDTAILKISCQDGKGIIAAVSGFISSHNGNIITLDEFVDRDSNTFFMRVEWDISGFSIERTGLKAAVARLTDEGGFGGNWWELYFSDELPKMALMVSKFDRHRAGELKCRIPLIISNHTDLEYIADFFGIAYHHVPKTADNKAEAENQEFALLDKAEVDFIVMARYMQVLSSDFLNRYRNRVINIHHSFLPAFEGAKPYHKAFERGVKVIGATAHFATGDLDKGPIIHQATLPVSHQDTVNDLITKGRDIEKRVLSDGVKLYIAHRVFVHGNRTVIL